jgi:hypothetical protein
MKRVVILLVLTVFGVINCFSQVSVASAKNKVVSNLVSSYLIGPNITLVVDDDHPAKFNEKSTVNSNQLGIFKNSNTTGCNIPMDTGLVITTSSYDIAGGGGYGQSASPSSDFSSFSDATANVFQWTYTKYCMEEGKTICALNDIGYLSFWIKPTIDNFQFSYCFASDEYPNYVGSSFNDFFGFYFSGPFDSVGNYIKGSPAYYMQNLALVPGTQTPVMINTVNHGGGYSSSGGSSYPEYHIVPSGSCSSSCGFNQWTVKLPTATTVVIADAYYKIDILICDISDHALHSGLYISKDMRRFDTINIDTTICENQDYFCSVTNDYLTESGSYQFVLENITGGDSVININLHINPVALENTCWEMKQGETLEVDDQTIAQPGTYIFNYSTYLNCDSTVVYNVEWGSETKEVDCVKTDTTSSKPKPSGIEDIDDNGIKIYPNPANDILTIEGNEGKTLVEFYDNNGRLVKSVVIQSTSQINIEDLSAGTYYLNITSEDKITTKQLIKR